MNVCIKVGFTQSLSVAALRRQFSVPLGNPGWSPTRRSPRPRCRSLRCCRLRRALRRGRCARSRRCRWTCRSGWRISVSPPAPVCTSTWAAWAGRNTCRTRAGSGREDCTCPTPRDRQVHSHWDTRQFRSIKTTTGGNNQPGSDQRMSLYSMTNNLVKQKRHV